MREVCFCDRFGDARGREPILGDDGRGRSGAGAVVTWTPSSDSQRRPALSSGMKPNAGAKNW